MTTRTTSEFNADILLQGDIPIVTSDFHSSENARLALRNAMGGAHEQEHCEHYSNTLPLRVMGCWQYEMIAGYREDWLAGMGVRGVRAGERAGNAARNAHAYFGGNVSVARERVIAQMLVDGRSTEFRIGDPRFAALQETFDDTTLLVQRTLVTVTINDELPRMLRPNESIKFDAPATLNFTNFVTTDTSGTLLNFALPEGFSLGVVAVYRAFHPPNRNQANPTPTEVTKPVAVNTDDNLIVSTLSAAINDTAPEAGESRREFVGLRATITATPTETE